MITEWLVGRFVGGESSEKDPEVRARYGLLEGWVGIVVNVVLLAVKGTLGLMSGSIALLADAVHTFADMATSGVVIVGFRIARKPSDEEHPFGHGRAETIAALIVSVIIIVVGVEFLRSSIERLIRPVALTVTWPMIAILGGTLIVKEWLARFALALSRRIGSSALEADFWHHRSDTLATAVVILGFIVSRWGLPWVDGVAGLAVSAIIVWSGVDIGRRAVSHLLGQAPTEEEVEEVRRKALEIAGVEGVHDVIIHRYGEVRVLSLHIEVPSDRTPLALHTLSERVEHRLSDGGGSVVVVHVDPISRDHPHYDAVREILNENVSRDPRIRSFHDLRIVGGDEGFNILFDLVVKDRGKLSEEAELKKTLTRSLQERFPGIRTVIRVERAYVRSA